MFLLHKNGTMKLLLMCFVMSVFATRKVMDQRVVIARVIVNEPKVILADEPTGNLDGQNREEIMLLLKNLNENGTTVIMVTHDLELTNYASRVIPIFEGEIQK